MHGDSNITVSIVLYKNDIKEVKLLVTTCLKSQLISKIYLIDNSPSKELQIISDNERVVYKHSSKNIGFGRGHNLVLESLNLESDFHLILNSDVSFKPEILQNLILPFQKEKNLTLIAPRLLFPNGAIQTSSRKHPTFFNLTKRFLKLTKNNNYLGKETSAIEDCFSTEFLHGAFLLFRTKDFIELKGFDQRFFLYLEDADICKRILINGKEIYYYPKFEAYHGLRKESSKKPLLFLYHLSSAIKYFLKWGFN